MRVSLVATFLASIVTPGSTPPLVSLIVPESVALVVWAKTDDGSSRIERDIASTNVGMTVSSGKRSVRTEP